jgi:hypothetical protein
LLDAIGFCHESPNELTPALPLANQEEHEEIAEVGFAEPENKKFLP